MCWENLFSKIFVEVKQGFLCTSWSTLLTSILVNLFPKLGLMCGVPMLLVIIPVLKPTLTVNRGEALRAVVTTPLRLLALQAPPQAQQAPPQHLLQMPPHKVVEWLLLILQQLTATQQELTPPVAPIWEVVLMSHKTAIISSAVFGKQMTMAS